MERLLNKINNLIEQGEQLAPKGGDMFYGYNGKDQAKFVAWRLEVIDILSQLENKGQELIKEINSDDRNKNFYKSSVRNILGVLAGAKNIIKNNPEDFNKLTKTDDSINSSSLFIVHGHDNSSLQTLARFIESLDIKPIILSEEPGRGKTIIEKLENNSDVDYSIILFTPDDEGRKTGNDELNYRARQNVVLELGYFLGKLGRENVAVLYDEKVEMPSDYRGVEYIKLVGGNWELKLAKELKAAGFDFDLNQII